MSYFFERQNEELDEVDKKKRQEFLAKMNSAKPPKPNIRWRECFITAVMFWILAGLTAGGFIFFTGDNIGQNEQVAQVRADFEKTIADIDAKTSEAITKLRKEKDAVIAGLKADLEKKNTPPVIPSEAKESQPEEISKNLISIETNEATLISIVTWAGTLVILLHVIGVIVTAVTQKRWPIWTGLLCCIVFLIFITLIATNVVSLKETITTCQIHGELVTEEADLPIGIVCDIYDSNKECGCCKVHIIERFFHPSSIKFVGKDLAGRLSTGKAKYPVYTSAIEEYKKRPNPLREPF